MYLNKGSNNLAKVKNMPVEKVIIELIAKITPPETTSADYIL